MKKIFKIVLVLIISIIALVAILVGINHIDTKKSDLTKALFDNQITVPLAQNGDVYLKGFHAPAGQTPLDIGHLVYNRAYKKNEDTLLTYQGNEKGLYCWFKDEPPIDEICQSSEELQETVSKNKVLLNRLNELFKYKNFDSEMPQFETFRGQDFILLEVLFNAHLMSLKSLGHTEQAINLWIENMNMLNNMLSSRRSLVFSAIVMIIQNLSDDVILQLTEGYKISPETLSKIESALIRPAFGKNGMNLEKIYQAEYNYVFKGMDKFSKELKKEHDYDDNKTIPFYLANNAKNMYAKYANKMIEASKLTSQEFEEIILKEPSIINKFFSDWLTILYNPTGKMIVKGITKRNHLLHNRSQTVKERSIIFQRIKDRNINTKSF